MRYFLQLACAKPMLASGVSKATLACRAITRAGPLQGRLARAFSATAGAVHVAPIAIPADEHLAMAAGTVVKTRTG